MSFMRYGSALLTPTGRLPRSPFVVLVAICGMIFMVLQVRVGKSPATAWGIEIVLMLALMWCMYCLVSRRMHDLGKGSAVALVLLLVAAATFLATIDPRFLGETKSAQAAASTALEAAWSGAQFFFGFIVFKLFRLEGDAGQNAFGLPYDAGSRVLPAASAANAGDGNPGWMAAVEERMMREAATATTGPANAAPRLHATPGSRKRQGGFGRR